LKIWIDPEISTDDSTYSIDGVQSTNPPTSETSSASNVPLSFVYMAAAATATLLTLVAFIF
jgi:hypothetical protein